MEKKEIENGGNLSHKEIKGVFTPIKIEFFIVPNTAVKGCEMVGTAYQTLANEWEMFGVKTSLNDMFVQIWLTDENNDNLSDHGLPESMHHLPCQKIREGMYQAKWAHYIPLNLIKDLREGETLSISTNSGISVELVAQQKKYRYRTFGSFEDCLTTVTSRRRK